MFPPLIPLLLAIAAAQPESNNGAIFIDRPALQGHVVGIDAQWNVKFQVADKVQVVPAADLVYWGAYQDTATGPQIVLADGSLIRADLLELTPDILTLGDATGLGRCLWDESSLPRQSVCGLLLQPPADPLARDKLLARLRKYDGAEDALLLSSGELIAGVVQEAPKAGRFLPESEPPVDVFRLARPGLDEPLAVPAAKVVAILFGNVASPPPPNGLSATLGFREGSLLVANKIVAKGNTVEITLAGGGRLSAPLDQADEAAPTLWRQITWLQVAREPADDRLTYLSDLKPLGYKHIPLLTLAWPYGDDQNALGGRLRSSGSLFPKGLGMHSASRLAYDLAGQYRRFEAGVALDDAAGLQGSVTFKVLVEGQPGQWTTAYESPIVRGGEPPLTFSVNLKDARRLALIVDFADRGDEQDHANWLMARLIK